MPPYQVWTGKKYLLASLKVFGCHAYVRVSKEKRSNFDARSVHCRFLCYSEHEKAYRFEDIGNGRVMTSRDARFMEEVFDHVKRRRTVAVQDRAVVDEPSFQCYQTDQDTDDAVPDQDFMADSTKHSHSNPHRSSTLSLEASGINAIGHLNRRYDSQIQETESSRPLHQTSATASYFASAYAVDSVGEMPTSFMSAMQSTNAAQWKGTCDSEVASLHKNKTWELVPLPQGCMAIGCRWVFRTKEDQAGEVGRFKVRLVTKGFLQKYGADYENVCSGGRVHVDLNPAQFSAKFKMTVHQMDVKTDFLNIILDEDIYMAQPDGYINEVKPDYVCQLKRFLYGLKQSPRM